MDLIVFIEHTIGHGVGHRNFECILLLQFYLAKE